MNAVDRKVSEEKFHNISLFMLVMLRHEGHVLDMKILVRCTTNVPYRQLGESVMSVDKVRCTIIIRGGQVVTRQA